MVDGNVERVLSRLFLLTDDPRSTSGRKRFWAKAEAILPPGQAGDWNQALMELGALVCTPRQPRCDDCPLVSECRAAKAGTQLRYPLKKKARRPVKILEVAGLHRREDGALLIARRPANALLGGMWELPGGGLGETRCHKAALATAWCERLGLDAEVGELRELLVECGRTKLGDQLLLQLCCQMVS